MIKPVLAVAAAAIGFVSAAPAASASTTKVGCGDVAGLVAAIDRANADPAPDTITLADGCTYTLTTPNASDPAVGLPHIVSDVTFEGSNATIARDAAAPHMRLAWIGGGAAVRFDHITLENGYSGNAGGAMVIVGGDVTIDHSQLLNNTTSGFAAFGGAIRSFGGTLDIRHTRFVGNTVSSEGAFAVGGGIYTDDTTTTIDHTRFEQNEALGFGPAVSQGGAIVTGGSLAVDHSAFTDNVSIAENGDDPAGAIYGDYGTVSIAHTRFSGNVSGPTSTSCFPELDGCPS